MHDTEPKQATGAPPDLDEDDRERDQEQEADEPRGPRTLAFAQADEITPGTEVSGTLDTANETDAWRFSVVAGQRFYFCLLYTSPSPRD